MNTLAIIGGTGLYDLQELENREEQQIDTPFGSCSAAIVSGTIAGNQVLFLPRHGINHQFLPHEVNYRANIWALKKLGATGVLSISATGSLNKDLAPGEIVLVDQYFDHTRGKREHTFFGGGITAHILSSEPACPNLRADILAAAKQLALSLPAPATYACVEGPRLGTKAESLFLKNAVGADLVGMTNIPEVFLAREAQLSYATLAIVTDYDCWFEDPAMHADISEIFKVYKSRIETVKQLICQLAAAGLSERPELVANALTFSVLTPDSALNFAQKDLLALLRK